MSDHQQLVFSTIAYLELFGVPTVHIIVFFFNSWQRGDLYNILKININRHKSVVIYSTSYPDNFHVAFYNNLLGH
jgi:hypothetical protein